MNVSMSSFTQRMIGAAKLDANLYEEVEADKSAWKQAMAVVVLASVAAGIGTVQRAGVSGILVGTLIALIGWYIWAYITYIIGTKLLPRPQTHATHGQLLRTIGFSASPGMIRVLSVIPGLTTIVFVVSGIWMLAAMIVAVRQALDYESTLRALGVCALGWLIQGIVLAISFSIFGAPEQASLPG